MKSTTAIGPIISEYNKKPPPRIRARPTITTVPYGTLPDEEQPLAHMCGLYAAGHGFSAIASLMNGLPWRPRSGRPWCPTHVARVILRACGQK